MTLARSYSIALLLLAGGAPALQAQTIETIVLTGDTVPGIGTVTIMRGVAIDDSGSALVHVWTDNPSPDLDNALLDENGNVVFAEGQGVTDPPGGVIENLGAGEIDVGGNGTPVLFARLVGMSENHFYVGTGLDFVIKQSSPITDPAYPPGSTFGLILPPLINDSSEILFHTVVSDPTLPDTYDYKALFKINTTTGVQTTVLREGDFVSADPTFPVDDIAWGRHKFSLNDAGQVMYVAGTVGPPSMSAFLYIDDTFVAAQCQPSSYGITHSAFQAFNLNNHGEYVLQGRMNTIQDDHMIELNGTPFVRQGDTLPDIEPFELTGIGGRSIHLGDNGRVLWIGRWEPTQGQERFGLFIDYTLLVEQFSTQLNGLTLQNFVAWDRPYQLSSNGRYVIFIGILEGGVYGAFRIDMGS